MAKSLTKYKENKLVRDLDYDLIRLSETPLTQEINYCINEVLVVSAYIKEQIEKEGDISLLPLTATGYCRNYVRQNCLHGPVNKDRDKQFKQYHEMIRHLTIPGSEEYEQLQRDFQGSFTHDSTRFSNITLSDENYGRVSSFDFSLAYLIVPYQNSVSHVKR